jgi:hypothetical protein
MYGSKEPTIEGKPHVLGCIEFRVVHLSHNFLKRRTAFHQI